MTPNTSARMVVVKKDEKESKITQLLAQAILAHPSTSGPTRGVIRVLAQSVNSPVVRALTTCAHDIAAAGLMLEVVFAHNPPAAEHTDTGTVRHLSDVRCHDAHELLVLEPTAVWIGDCMRRDPVTRDSFELHGLGQAETARWAAMCFASIWARAVPLGLLPARTDAPAIASPVSDVAVMAEIATVAAEVPNPVMVLTRH